MIVNEFDVVEKLNCDFLKNYVDKTNQPIDFDVFFIKEKEDSHFSQFIIQANSNGEMAPFTGTFDSKLELFDNTVIVKLPKEIFKSA
jgi:hypothetical protein